jgi:hypothetical protein
MPLENTVLMALHRVAVIGSVSCKPVHRVTAEIKALWKFRGMGGGHADNKLLGEAAHEKTHKDTDNFLSR